MWIGLVGDDLRERGTPRVFVASFDKSETIFADCIASQPIVFNIGTGEESGSTARARRANAALNVRYTPRVDDTDNAH